MAHIHHHGVIRAIPNYTKKTPRADKVLQEAKSATAHGGMLVVDAIAKDFGLWKKIADIGCLDPRKNKRLGFSPEAVVAQMVFSLCSGGVSLADAGRLGGDPVLGKLLGMDRWADESTLGEWLRAQQEHGLKELALHQNLWVKKSGSGRLPSVW